MTDPDSAQAPAERMPRQLKIAAAAIALLAALLGGSVARWSQGVILIAIGALVWMRSPRYALPRGFLPIVGAFLALSLFAFLPAQWFSTAEWRQELAGLGVIFPKTLSPQPWLTLDAFILLLGGATWLGWLSAQRWNFVDRNATARYFAAGVIAFAALALALYFRHLVPPSWSAPRGLGPFPNRNQTGDFFAVGGIMVLACGFQSWNRGRKTWPFWLAGFVIVAGAVLVSYSRAGVAILVCGAAVWIALLCIFSGSVGHLGVGISCVLILLSAFLFYGGETIERFRQELGPSLDGILGFRGLIFQDALQMIWRGPWCGAGLANFRGVFPFFRSATNTEVVLIHPESDWLWAGAELGWGGVLLIFAALGFLLVRILPFGENSDRRLRSAALVGGMAFVLHGFVDVSGHRLGTIIPALLVLSLGFRSEREWRPSRGMPVLFRACGTVLMVVGATWLFCTWRGVRVPGAVGVALAKQEAGRLNDANRFDESVRVTTEALGWAPLDWQLYFSRAAAKAASEEWVDALADFRICRHLQPAMSALALAEGRVWLALQPALALPAWREALATAPPGSRPELYRQMLALAPPDPNFQTAARALAGSDPSLKVVYLTRAQPEEIPALVAEIMAADPALRQLDDAGKAALFEAWAGSGDFAGLEKSLVEHPAWLKAGWRSLASQYAVRKDFARASQLALANLPTPALPVVPDPAPPPAELERRILGNPNDFASAYTLYVAQSRSGNSEAALFTLQRAGEQPNRPLYFSYLEAREHAGRAEWPQAWEAIEKLIR